MTNPGFDAVSATAPGDAHGPVDRVVPAAAVGAADWLRARLGPGAALRADSRAVAPGDAFLAYPGLTVDGRAFVAQALARGAAAIVLERSAGAATSPGDVPRDVPVLEIDGLRELVGPIASAWHGRPSERMEVVAVTGTNGKTSTTQWLARGFERLGRRGAVIGTLGCGIVGDLEHSGMTTPDAIGLQALLAGFRTRGVDSVALEASSIGLDQGRLNGTRVAVAAFTNLSRDHLDYHGTMERYARSKARLFAWPGLRAVVVNGDDRWAPAMLEAVAAEAGAACKISERLCDGAFSLLRAGDRAGHDAAVRAGFAALGRDVDLIVLAQASMADAMAGQDAALATPFLTSPELGMAHIAARLRTLPS